MKKEIEFDFAKWGQEGIIVETKSKKLVVKLHENPINDEFYGVLHDGCAFAVFMDKLIMFDEVKPREFWVNVYPQLENSDIHKNEGSAISSLMSGGKTIKVREVLD